MSIMKIKGEITEVKLTNYDKPFIIDTNMVDRVKQCKSWNLLFKRGRIDKIQGHIPGIGRVILAREIMQDELAVSELNNPVVDHIDRNPLNNVKSNLRVTTQSQNNRSKTKKAGTSSRFPGVCWDKKSKKWKCQIQIDGKYKHIGYFTDEKDAARSYRRVYRLLDPISDFEVWAELDKPEPVQQQITMYFKNANVYQQSQIHQHNHHDDNDATDESSAN